MPVHNTINNTAQVCVKYMHNPMTTLQLHTATQGIQDKASGLEQVKSQSFPLEDITVREWDKN